MYVTTADYDRTFIHKSLLFYGCIEITHSNKVVSSDSDRFIALRKLEPNTITSNKTIDTICSNSFQAHRDLHC